MKPIVFTEGMAVCGKDQPQYLPLPALQMDDGILLICWKLSVKERLKLLFTGKLWHYISTYGHPLQPVILTTEWPELP
jgi:hypothetical protein